MRPKLDAKNSYTKADNSVVVATDTIKNTTYIMAKQNPVSPPESFAAILGTHFIETYEHIWLAHVEIVIQRWARMVIGGQNHPHSFFRDDKECRAAEVHVHSKKGIDIRSSLSGLLVLKSTGSQFHGFMRDDYTTLPDLYDRILSTSIDASWKWETFSDKRHVISKTEDFDNTWMGVRDVTMKTFAEDSSASVQNTMYKTCEQVLASYPTVASISYALPNNHYFEIDLSWHHGLQNTGRDATVYAPQSNPNGLIKCTVTR